MYAFVLGVLVCAAGEARTDGPHVDGVQTERPAERPAAICELDDPNCRLERPFDAPAHTTLRLIQGDPTLIAIFARLPAPGWDAHRYLTADGAGAHPGFARRVERPPRS